METGDIKKLAEILKKEKAERIFLVVDKGSYGISGAEAQLEGILERYTIRRFDDFEPNPKIEDIQKGILELQAFKPDIVIAVGGGSVIDMAKSVNILSQQEGDIKDYVTGRKEIAVSGKPLIAVPTTAGTGSEVTHFAVAYIGKTKYSLAHASMLPTHSIVDPQLTFKLPAHITASTGMDALSQAIESYWSVRSTDESKQYAREAIPMILSNLSDAVNKGTKESRLAMAKAAHLSGKAIDISQTTACHAVSYPITSYFNVSHGHACALTLAGMLEFNSEVDKESCTDKRGVEYVKGVIQDLVDLFGVDDAASAKRKIQDLMKDIHLETRLSELGIADIELIVTNGFNPQRMKNNPRLIIKEDLRMLLRTIQ